MNHNYFRLQRMMLTRTHQQWEEIDLNAQVYLRVVLAEKLFPSEPDSKLKLNHRIFVTLHEES